MLISPKPFPVLLLCVATLALAAVAYGAEPPAKEPTAAVADAEAAEAGTVAASSVVAWDADHKVFVTPTDHEARRVAEDLRQALENTSYFSSAEAQEKAYALETVRPGLVRKRVGIEGLSVYRLRMGDDGMPVSACVQTHAEAPASAPSEGWVER